MPRKLRVIEGSGLETLFSSAHVALPRRRRPPTSDVEVEWWSRAESSCRDLLEAPYDLQKLMHTLFIGMNGIDPSKSDIPLPPLVVIYERRDLAIMQRMLAGEPVKPRALVVTLERALKTYKGAIQTIMEIPKAMAIVDQIVKSGKVRTVYLDDDPPPAA